MWFEEMQSIFKKIPVTALFVVFLAYWEKEIIYYIPIGKQATYLISFAYVAE